MGLDTSHNCWHGPYSAFKRFRDAIADAAKKVDGYEPDYDAHPWRAYAGWWWEGPDEGNTRTHPLDVFFVHSDCDGYIFPQDALDLIPALERVGAHVEGELRPGVEMRKALDQFIQGLRDAVDEWEIVEFR